MQLQGLHNTPSAKEHGYVVLPPVNAVLSETDLMKDIILRLMIPEMIDARNISSVEENCEVDTSATPPILDKNAAISDVERSIVSRSMLPGRTRRVAARLGFPSAINGGSSGNAEHHPPVLVPSAGCWQIAPG